MKIINTIVFFLGAFFLLIGLLNLSHRPDNDSYFAIVCSLVGICASIYVVVWQYSYARDFVIWLVTIFEKDNRAIL